MGKWTQNQKIGAAIAVVIVAFLAYTLWPSGGKHVSKDDVKAACTAGGIGTASLVGGWKTSGRLKAAALVATSLGFYQCSKVLGSLTNVSSQAPIFTVTIVPPLQQGLSPTLTSP